MEVASEVVGAGVEVVVLGAGVEVVVQMQGVVEELEVAAAVVLL